MITAHSLSLGPLSLLADQHGPLLTITIHAPSDSAPVGKMTLTVPEWTALVALVDSLAVADKRAKEQEARVAQLEQALRDATAHESDLWLQRNAAQREVEMLRRATTRIVDVSDPDQCDHNRRVDPDTGECLDCGTVLP